MALCQPAAVFRYELPKTSHGRATQVACVITSWWRLTSVQGFRTVPVESGRSYTHDPVWRPTLMTIAEFIDNHVLVDSTGPVHYLAQHDLFEQVPELRHDAPIPDYCIGTLLALSLLWPLLTSSIVVAFDAEEPVVRSSVWFGPAGTQTPLHTDPEDNLLCQVPVCASHHAAPAFAEPRHMQVFGSKYVRLYFAADTPRVHPRQDMPNTSEVDLANPDRDRFPLFDTVPCFETTLNQGDMLFIPKGYLASLVNGDRRCVTDPFWIVQHVALRRIAICKLLCELLVVCLTRRRPGRACPAA